MFAPVIIGPVILPEIPDPTATECQTLLTYTERLITSLKTVQARLNEASNAPDESLLTIKSQVANMLFEAEKLKKNLNTIKAEATRKSNLANQGLLIT